MLFHFVSLVLLFCQISVFMCHIAGGGNKFLYFKTKKHPACDSTLVFLKEWLNIVRKTILF